MDDNGRVLAFTPHSHKGSDPIVGVYFEYTKMGRRPVWLTNAEAQRAWNNGLRPVPTVAVRVAYGSSNQPYIVEGNYGVFIDFDPDC